MRDRANARQDGRQSLVALTILVVLAGGFLLPWAHGAGFAADDWAIAERVERLGLSGAIDEGVGVLGSRPLLGVYLPLPFVVFGTAPALGHAVVATVLAVATSATFLVVLRRLGFGAADAGAVAVLALLFPWASSTRFWLTASINELAVLAYLAGLLVSLRAFASTGRRARALHATGVALYCAAVLTYEIAAGVALLSGALYLTRAPWRRVASRWAADVVVVGGVVVWSLAAGDKVDRPLEDQLANAVDMARGAVRLAAAAVVPVDRGLAVVALAIAVVCGAAAHRAWRVRGRSAPGADPITMWLLRAAVAAVAAVVCWAPLVPSAYWTPLLPGLEDRVNVLAALPLAVFAVSVLRLVSLLVTRGDRRPATVVFAGGVVLLGAAYGVRLADEADAWADASRQRDAILATVDRELPDLPHRSRVYVVGAPAVSAPGVAVFAFSYDLWGALRTRRDDFTLTAHPAPARSRFSCEQDGVRAVALRSPTYERDLVRYVDPMSAYGRTWFVDVRPRAASPLAAVDAASCRRIVASLDL